MRVPRTTIALAAISLACAGELSAQPAASQARRFEVSAGAAWLDGAGLGSADARLRPGGGSGSTGSFTLFATESRAASAPGFDARVGYWITPTLAIEGGFVRSQPELQTTISGDFEGAADLTVAEQLDQYFIDANVVWVLDRLRLGERTAPFVAGGAGYLRQLHEGRTLVETGQVYNVGGGLRHTLYSGTTGWVRNLGARVDARAYVLVGGVQLEERPRTHAALSGAVFVTF
jgi:hypothetical protein